MVGRGTNPLSTHIFFMEMQPFAPRAQKSLGGENAFLENAKIGNLMRSRDVQDVVTSPVITLPQLCMAAQPELPAAPNRRKEWSLTWEIVQTVVLL